MRTEYCGNINSLDIGKNVKLCGWVNEFRKLKNLIFIDIRDCTGIVQVLFDLNKYPEVFKIAANLRKEYCIQVTGTVVKRKNINSKKKNGNIEISSNKLTIFNYSDPIPLDFTKENSEVSRLKYRYLDLRRIEMQNNLKLRSSVTNIIRNFMEENKFINIETPFLTKSTPEGARDYIVPSRLNKGKFYALPQSPQLFKQLLMISGFDRYYQVVKCFRDEDLRTDRQPEFTQVDVEMSFMNSLQVRNIMEELIRTIWLKIKGIDLGNFPTMTFSDAIYFYGSDKPDLRNTLEIIDISYLIDKISYKSFFDCNNIRKKLIVIKIPNIYNLSNEKILKYFNSITNFYIKKLFFIKVDILSKTMYSIENPLFQETVEKSWIHRFSSLQKGI